MFIKAFLVLMLVYALDAAVFQALPKARQEYGSTVTYCEYKGLNLLPKSKFKDYDDCVKCTCTKNGLVCASLAETINDIPADSKCTSVVVGCANRWVLKKNNDKKCPRKWRPTSYSAVGK